MPQKSTRSHSITSGAGRGGASLRLRSTNDLTNLRARESSPSGHQSSDT